MNYTPKTDFMLKVACTTLLEVPPPFTYFTQPFFFTFDFGFGFLGFGSLIFIAKVGKVACFPLQLGSLCRHIFCVAKFVLLLGY
ncbi:MAG: hypothetical protein WCS37_06735 [Chloroflexota bacterium]|nr:hypothetical protein [Chloroflexota bacterium]